MRKIDTEKLVDEFQDLSQPKMEKLKSLLDRFDKLDKKYKISLIEEFLDLFEEKLVKQEHEQSLDTCENEGHVWGNWKEGSQTKYGIYCPADLLNPMRGQPYSYEVPIWVRTCERCGCEETRDYNDVPEEIIEGRAQKIKRKQIINGKQSDD